MTGKEPGNVLWLPLTVEQLRTLVEEKKLRITVPATAYSPVTEVMIRLPAPPEGTARVEDELTLSEQADLAESLAQMRRGEGEIVRPDTWEAPGHPVTDRSKGEIE